MGEVNNMGGSLAVTIREENGEEHRMCRWTNPLPGFIKNIRLMNKDSAHVREYLKVWQDMRADYARHKDEWDKLLKENEGKESYFKDPFENNMTSCYAPFPFLAPQDYGLVVVDMQKNHILTSQEYSNLGVIDDSGVGLCLLTFSSERDKSWFDKERFYAEDSDSDAVRFRELFEAGRITEAVKLREGMKKVSLEGKTLDNIIEIIEGGGTYFPIDISPFTLIEYPDHSADGAKEMKSKIIDLGFSLSDEENKLWDEWIREYN